MPRIYVEFQNMRQIGTRCRSAAARISSIDAEVQRVVRQMDWDIRYEADINATARRISQKLSGYAAALNRYQRFIEDACAQYVRLDSEMDGEITEDAAVKPESSGTSWWDSFWQAYGWSGLLAGSNYIGTLYDLISDIRNGATWRDFAKSGVELYQFLNGAAKTYRNYQKIGNAVGTRTAMSWWAKQIVGIKPLGRASSAKNPFTRFVNNLTNKTSPFHSQFTNILDNFKGANGVGKAAASWGAVALTGVLNWFDNKEEQASSNGTMSDGRVIAETITETAVDTALTYGTGIVVGAAVTTLFGTVAAPGVLVVAASGAVVAGLNVGVEALTGKSTTEWISDAILDTGEAIGTAVTQAVDAVGSWFSRLSFG